jgi:hypothetical protein
MLASNCHLSATSGEVAASLPRVRQRLRPAELAHWHRAYIGVSLEIAAKLLVLGVVLSFALRATTHVGYSAVDHDRWHAVQERQVAPP